MRDDAPINIKGWKPENYTDEYFGPVTLETAFAMSLNTVAVRLANEVGPKAVAATAPRLGIRRPSSRRLDRARHLGGDAARARRRLCALRQWRADVEPHVISDRHDGDGQGALPPAVDSGMGASSSRRCVAMMNAMMRETCAPAPARKAAIPGWDAAGKTGTTRITATPGSSATPATSSTGVWLGNDDNSPMKKVTGGGAPAEIWNRFMRAALAGSTPVALPSASWQHSPGLSEPSPPQPMAMPASPASPPSVAPAPGPMVLNAGGAAGQARPIPIPDGAPRPPGSIPNTGDRGWVPPQPKQKGFFDALFGN